MQEEYSARVEPGEGGGGGAGFAALRYSTEALQISGGVSVRETRAASAASF